MNPKLIHRLLTKMAESTLDESAGLMTRSLRMWLAHSKRLIVVWKKLK